jgi:hypothetical protein
VGGKTIMRCYGEIDFHRPTTVIEKISSTIQTNLNRRIISIDRVVALWLLEKQRSTISIDKETYKVISVYVPYFTEWVILQNDYLPQAGEYFLN